MARARILIIEDEADTQELLADVLLLEGYDVRRADEAAGALGLVRRAQPDLLILDLRLPGVSGLDLLRLLSVDRDLCYLPVLICSGAQELITDHADEIRHLEAQVLQKPFELDDLLDAVHSVLARGRRVPGRQ